MNLSETSILAFREDVIMELQQGIEDLKLDRRALLHFVSHVLMQNGYLIIVSDPLYGNDETSWSLVEHKSNKTIYTTTKLSTLINWIAIHEPL